LDEGKKKKSETAAKARGKGDCGQFVEAAERCATRRSDKGMVRVARGI
jgi:hypothetical protein